MFDVGFWELVLCAIVALVVLGPERMPVAVRSVAHWVRIARSTLNAVKSEFEHELALGPLKPEQTPDQQAPHTTANETMPSSQTAVATEIQQAIAELKAAAIQRAGNLGAENLGVGNLGTENLSASPPRTPADSDQQP